MKKRRHNLFRMFPRDTHNLISASGNFCDHFVAFLRSSTFKKRKRTNIVQNLVLRKDNLIVFIETFKKTRKKEHQQALKKIAGETGIQL